MKVIPYINFCGQAEDALNFYAKALNGEISDIMRFSKEMMPDIPEHMSNWAVEIKDQFDKIYEQAKEAVMKEIKAGRIASV